MYLPVCFAGNPAQFWRLMLALMLPAAHGQAGHGQGAMVKAPRSTREEDRECGPLVSPKVDRLPPKDYRTDRAWLGMVENQHFPPDVENLVKPLLSTFGAAIAYTLHGYPNHVRALATLERLTEREKDRSTQGADYSLDCYYRRAIRFVPDDLLVR